MTYKYNGININYEIYGYGNIPIVFLHGWGGSIESLSFICKDLDFNFKFGNDEKKK